MEAGSLGASFPLTTAVLMLRFIASCSVTPTFQASRRLFVQWHTPRRSLARARTLLVWHTSSREARAQEHVERSLLHEAAARGLVQVCARLLAKNVVVNVRCRREGMTPSHVAGAHCEVDVLAFLLGHHANANEVDEENRTPLALVLGILSKPTPCILAWNNEFHFKVCSLLLEAQAEVGMSCRGVVGLQSLLMSRSSADRT